jgi:hypothetical protein
LASWGLRSWGCSYLPGSCSGSFGRSHGGEFSPSIHYSCVLMELVRGHPSVSLLPLSSPTLPLSICTPYTHLCIISKDRTYSRRPPGLMVRRLPASPPACTSTASDGLRMHQDRSA